MARILVVDDLEEGRYLLQGLLQETGHWVETAATGAEALAAASRSPPDLAISDIFMPEMDGFELCRAWRQDAALRDIPFIFYSATFTGSEDERFALALGADRFIAKPRAPEDLLAEIDAVLAEQQAGRLTSLRRAPTDELSFLANHEQMVMQKLQAKMVELERTNLRLAEAEAKFRALVEQSLAGIFIVDGRDRLTYVNPRFAEIFGYAQGELLQRDIFSLIAEADHALVRERVLDRTGGLPRGTHYAVRGRRKDGSHIDLGIHGAPTRLTSGPSVIGMLQDITEQRRAEARLDEYVGLLERALSGTLRAVAKTVELRDPYTAGHERRVGELAAAIAAEMGLAADVVHGLRVIGPVHDVGKISVPADLLNKPGRLSSIEYELIKTHAEQGYEILKDTEFPWPVAKVILQHHERLDGSGYPQGLKGDEILIEARILSVADVVEAMASHRPYRAGLGMERALEEIEKGAGRLYDPDVAAACLRLFREKDYVLPQ